MATSLGRTLAEQIEKISNQQSVFFTSFLIIVNLSIPVDCLNPTKF